MKNTMLIIMDGFGINYDLTGNAIATAYTPNLDDIFSTYPHTTLGASGLDVGLPQGQMGNSEVGHLNIGAGRIVYQELTRISKEIHDGNFEKNQVISAAMAEVTKKQSALHLMGLLSDGGVHSHITHLFALLDMAKHKNIESVYIHCFLDGRDVPPQNAKTYIQQLEDYISKIGLGKISTISGRYYAMDRDNRWERVKMAYDALSSGIGEHAQTAIEAVDKAYAQGKSDEFVLPTVIDGGKTISDHDSIIMFNFRPDRAREITRSFIDPNFSGFAKTVSPKDLYYVCMTQYDAAMPNVHVAFSPQLLKNTLGEYISHCGLKQLRIAETEKYAHVTFFFNGGVEAPNLNEDRVLIPSPKVATYDLMPEMSAYKITTEVARLIETKAYDLIILNFANPDMVGHTGVFQAAVKAVEAVDACVGIIKDAILKAGGQLLITADHGNAEHMLDTEGHIVTAHSTSPVPLVLISHKNPGKLKSGGILADIAPTLLELMNLKQPAEMTGRSLYEKSGQKKNESV